RTSPCCWCGVSCLGLGRRAGAAGTRGAAARRAASSTHRPSTLAFRAWLNISPTMTMPPGIHCPRPPNSGWSNCAMVPWPCTRAWSRVTTASVLTPYRWASAMTFCCPSDVSGGIEALLCLSYVCHGAAPGPSGCAASVGWRHQKPETSRGLLIGGTHRRIPLGPCVQLAPVCAVDGGALPDKAHMVVHLRGRAASHHHGADPGEGKHIPHGLLGREFVRPQQRPLGIDLHPDHPHPPLGGVCQGGRDEGQAVDIGRVHRQERGVKREAPHRLLENRRVVMPRHPEKPHQALRTGLHQGLERPAR